MHIYFSGIGGTGIGPLSLIAKEAGYMVSGSDKQDSLYIDYLREHGVNTIHIGQTTAAIAEVHARHPIDWLVYSSAVEKENIDAEELVFAREHGIRTSKRDELLNQILVDKKLSLIAISGTHGKTTTTAMTIWLLQQLGIPVSYSVGAKLSFGDMGHYEPGSEYFVYEADEYDRNFLAFSPFYALITGITWDHQDIFETEDAYQEAFKTFLSQTRAASVWEEDTGKIQGAVGVALQVLHEDVALQSFTLLGNVNRRNAWQAVQAIHAITKANVTTLVDHMNRFPGVSRRFEALAPNLYTDYAHTYEKIQGAIGVALETNQNVVVVYEGLHNRRQHFMLEREQFAHLFDGVKKLYWVPSYLAREDPSQELLTPEKLIALTHLEALASPMQLDDTLWEEITTHLTNSDLVLCISAGGGGSLDEWVRAKVNISNVN